MPLHDPHPMRGKTVFITGAGSGIGAATARALHAEGANIALVDVDIRGIDNLLQELGDRAIALEASVTERDQLDRVVTAAVEAFGGIDVVFANAGISSDPPNTIVGMNSAAFETIIEVDLLGVWRTVRACLPQITAHRGHVLVTASAYAYLNGAANAPYAMSKAGVEMFGRTLRGELAGTGATAGVLYPGWVTTPMSHCALGGHAIASQLVDLVFPGHYRKAITPEAVARSVVVGIERRSARIHVPRRWAPVSALRGIVNPIVDLIVDHHPRIQQLIRELEASQNTPPALQQLPTTDAASA